MGMTLLTERYSNKIRGVLSCWDRVIITGTLPDICHPEAMATYLHRRKVRLFDLPRWAEPLREEMRAHAERLAHENGLTIDFIRRRNFRKEERVKEIIAKRGSHPGLVHIFSAMEPCPSFMPWHDKRTGKTFLRGKDAKCLHYYFYFIDQDLGLCYLRVPTWAPFRLQFYFNGHNLLASEMTKKGIEYELLDNVFVQIGDFAKAQGLVDQIRVEKLHGRLDRLARRFCPILRHFPSDYHWSLMQVEYALDIVFDRQSDLAPLYDALVRTAVHAIKAEHVATFLGRRLQVNSVDQVGNDFHTRVEGTRIRHQMGWTAIKMYDKIGLVLRIEVTTNNVSFFRHYRRVEHRDGTSETKYAPMKKSIYSLPALREVMAAANRRYLEFISTLDDPSSGVKKLSKVSEPVRDNNRTYRGFNFFKAEDLQVFEAIARGEFNVSGFRNSHVRRHLAGKTKSHVSRILKRLRLHGLIKKVGRTYKYYLTDLGRSVVSAGLSLRAFFLIPQLARPVFGKS